MKGPTSIDASMRVPLLVGVVVTATSRVAATGQRTATLAESAGGSECSSGEVDRDTPDIACTDSIAASTEAGEPGTVRVDRICIGRW